MPSDPLPEIRVRMGTKKTVPLVLGESSGILAEKSQAGTLVTHLDLETDLQAPIEKGRQVTVVAVTGNRVVVR